MSKPLRFGRAVTVMLAFALGLRTREFGKSNEVRWSFGDVTKKQISSPKGPLAHPEEQETFNLKVPGSRPGRPTFPCISSVSTGQKTFETSFTDLRYLLDRPSGPP